ncbi:MAG: Fe2+-dependent dioxygenase [Sphingopyxis sp.]|uniref:Fe2+-dependent dioxygenase n=1 Tax=Sphingopyxis sp. TaxID=1908224 RepID=UPI001A484DB8|nr:Fe2+-dependent dioxygenase [Sphingopyxis sp.]MBL9066626.1 Fe2+-dependent dioxygenase [Sphingopyxis sp.]
MYLVIDNVLTGEALARAQALLADAPWADGRATAGYQSAAVKRNEQLPERHPLTQQLQEIVEGGLAASLLFQSAALPRHIFPPLFNRYASGHDFGTHVDNAIRQTPGGAALRTDLSATLFLADPASYDGGELEVEDGSASHRFKLAAGSMLLYPATTLHRVTPVTRGARFASFFWVQSLVADAARRAILFDIDLGIQSLRPRVGDQDPALVALTGAYHNLLRQWAQP